MPKRQLKASELKGLFIYQDKNHGTVYYDILTGNGYIFTTSDSRYYTLSVAFLPVAVVIFYFLTQFGLSIAASLAIAIGAYALMQIIYRVKFLYKLPCIKNYKVSKKNNVITNLSENYSIQRLAVLTILSSLLVGATFAYISISNFEGVTLIGMIILGIITLVLFVICILALAKKKTSTKK